MTGSLFVQIGFLEPKGSVNQEDALKKIRAVHKALGDQAHSGRDFLGVLGVPAVCPTLQTGQVLIDSTKVSEPSRCTVKQRDNLWTNRTQEV